MTLTITPTTKMLSGGKARYHLHEMRPVRIYTPCRKVLGRIARACVGQDTIKYYDALPEVKEPLLAEIKEQDLAKTYEPEMQSDAAVTPIPKAKPATFTRENIEQLINKDGYYSEMLPEDFDTEYSSKRKISVSKPLAFILSGLLGFAFYLVISGIAAL